MPIWRLIIDGPLDGALNMALDRSAQLAHERGAVPPTLRLYRWSRPTVTLGRFQGLQAVNLGYCASNGIDVVRRPTGGRGVLHDDELTYAVIAGVADGIPRGVASSYRHLCAALAEAYQQLGVDAELVPHDWSEAPTSACYLSTTRADLSLGALKLSGSAQVWTGSTVLQHGSFTRTRISDREASVFCLDSTSADRLSSQTVTLTQALGDSPSFDRIRARVVDAFERTLGIELREGHWGALEAELAQAELPATRV